MKIGIIGAGRLGICFALLCEQSGYEVVVSDIRQNYINDINNKQIKTTEPEVVELLKNSSKLKATVNNFDVINECDIIYTLVATPSLDSGKYDVDSVWQVVSDIEYASKKINVSGKTLIVGCTTNPGDCAKFQEKLLPYGVDVFYNPEFIAQGSIINDLRHADMVLIGGKENDVYSKLCDLYTKIQVTTPVFNLMSTTSAELVKLAVNCFLTTKISYANMVGQVLTISGLEDEISKVLNAIGSDTRVGSKYLKYGYGFGGPCLPRDNRSFAAYAKDLGLEFNIGKTTDDFNNEHSKFLKSYFMGKNVNKVPFVFDYISYKKGTDILVESQQYKLCLDLLKEGYKVYINDNQCIIDQVKEYLKTTYNDNVVFNETPKEEIVYYINL